MQKTQIDGSNTDLWRSRDVGAQDLVFVKAPDSLYLRTYSDFLEYKLLYGISIPVYLIEKCRSMKRLDDVEICIDSLDGQEKFTIRVIRDGFYNQEIGIDLTPIYNFQ